MAKKPFDPITNLKHYAHKPKAKKVKTKLVSADKTKVGPPKKLKSAKSAAASVAKSIIKSKRNLINVD